MKKPFKLTLNSCPFLVFALLLTPGAKATSLLKNFPSLSRAEAPTTPAVETPLPHLFQGEFLQQDINACITSVCGPARSNWGAFDTLLSRMTQPSFSAQQMWQKRFQAQVKKNLEWKKKNAVQSAQRLIESLKKEMKLTPGEPIQAFAGFLKAFAPLRPHLAEFVTCDNNAKCEVKSEALEQSLAGQPEETKKASRLLFTQLLFPSYGIPSDDHIKLMLSTRLAERLKRKFPGLALKEAQSQDATHLLKIGSLLRQNLGPLGETFLDNYATHLLNQAKIGKDLNKLESDNYVDVASNLETMGAIFDGQELSRALLAVPLDLVSEIQNLRKSGYAEKNLAQAQNINIDDALIKISSSCQVKLANSLDLNASPLRYRKALEMVKDVKAAAKIVAARFADPNIKTEIEKALDAVEFALPETNQEHLQTLLNGLKMETLGIVKNTKLFASNDSSLDNFLVLAALVENNSGSFNPDKNDLSKDSEVVKACDALPPVDSVSDYTLTSLGKISLSWFTAAYPDLGVSIIAHELGHAASFNLRLYQYNTNVKNDNFNSSLTCIANRNPFVMTARNLSRFDNTPWSEEDFADHFSSLVLAELEKSHSFWFSPKNMACGLVLDMGDFYADTSLAPGKTDVHSSGFLRLLEVAQDRNQVTPACQRILTAMLPPQAGRSLSCQ